MHLHFKLNHHRRLLLKLNHDNSPLSPRLSSSKKNHFRINKKTNYQKIKNKKNYDSNNSDEKTKKVSFSKPKIIRCFNCGPMNNPWSSTH